MHLFLHIFLLFRRNPFVFAGFLLFPAENTERPEGRTRTSFRSYIAFRKLCPAAQKPPERSFWSP